ncbi:MAG: hypothetical protein EZS28_049960, partial [Streblomastix strix]
IAPLFDVLLQPNSIDELPVFSIVLAILNPSSKPAAATGLIYTLPEVTLAYEVAEPAFNTQFQTNLESGYYLDFDRSVGLTYKVFYIIPPYPQLQLIGITVPLDTPVTISYVNISVILFVKQVLLSVTTIVIEPTDSNLIYALQTADVPEPE